MSTPLYSTSSPLSFSIFGRPVSCVVNPAHDNVELTLYAEPGDPQSISDFIGAFGSAPLDAARLEAGTIGQRVFTLKTVSDALRDLYSHSPDCPIRPEVDILAEWVDAKEWRAVRARDSFGSYHTFQFATDGRVFMSEHTTWQQIANIAPAVIAIA